MQGCRREEACRSRVGPGPTPLRDSECQRTTCTHILVEDSLVYPVRPGSHRRVQVPAVKGIVGDAGVVAGGIAPTRVHPFGVVEAGPSPFVLIPGRSVIVENAVRPGVRARLVMRRVPRRRDCPEEAIGLIRNRNVVGIRLDPALVTSIAVIARGKPWNQVERFLRVGSSGSVIVEEVPTLVLDVLFFFLRFRVGSQSLWPTPVLYTLSFASRISCRRCFRRMVRTYSGSTSRISCW